MSDDYSNNIQTAGRLAVGGSATGYFEDAYDSDWYRISLQAGKTYLFSLNGVGQGGATPVDFSSTSLGMYDSQGQQVAWLSEAPSASPVLQFTAPASAVFYLAAFGPGNAAGSYTLKAVLPVDDFADNASTKGVARLDVDVHANTEVLGDRDWFKFHADAGQTYAFSSDAAPDFPTMIQVYDAHGDEIVMTSPTFSPLTSGDYFMSVAGRVIGPYTETVTLLPDDYSSNNVNPGHLAPGVALQGELQFADDVDRFQLDVAAGQLYTLLLTHGADDHTVIGASIVRSDGNVYFEKFMENGAGALAISFTAESTGIYSVDVKTDFMGWRGDSSAYQIKALVPTLDDYGDTADTAMALALNHQVNGTLQFNNDIDMFKLELQQGVTYRFDMLPAVAGADAPTFNFLLLNSDGFEIVTDQYGPVSAYSFIPNKSGSYYFGVRSRDSFTDDINYTFKASLVPDDYGSTAGTAGVLTVGRSISGVIEAGGGDRDWFAVVLKAGSAYQVRMTGAETAAGTLPVGGNSGLLQMLGKQGEVLANAAADPRASFTELSFVAPVDGIYYVQAGAQGRATGSYKLLLTETPPDDVGNDVGHAASILPGRSIRAQLETPADHDVFVLDAVAGTTYLLELSPTLRTGSSWGTGLQLVVSDSANAVVSMRPQPLADGTAGLFEATATGRYYFTIAEFNSSQTGSYLLKLTSLGKDDYGDTSQSAGAMAVTDVLHGVLGTLDDHDWIKVHLDAGSYLFDLRGPSGTAVELKDLFGYRTESHMVASADPRLAVTAYVAGNYYFDVHGDGRSTGAYTLAAVDDYSSESSHTGSVAAGGQASGILEFPGDSDRFMLNVEAGKFYTLVLATVPGAAHPLRIAAVDSNGAASYTMDSHVVDGALTVTFGPDRSGLYAFDVSNGYASSAALPYTLTVSLPQADDYGNTIASATPLLLKQPLSGKLQAVDDIDMFSVALSAGVTYSFDLLPASAGVLPAILEFSLFDSAGNILPTPKLPLLNNHVSYTPAASGNYYFAAYSQYLGDDNSLGYTLAAQAVSDDYGANSAAAGKLAVGGSLSGTLEAGGGDRDWFAVTLNAGAAYWFTLSGALNGGGTLTPSAGGAQLRLLDAGGTVLASQLYTNTSPVWVLPYTAANQGTYYVEVTAPGAAGSYKIQAQTGLADDYGGDAAHAAALTDGRAISGRLELANDKDVFKLGVVAGATYALELWPVQPGAANWTNGVSLSVSDSKQAAIALRTPANDSGSIYGLFDATSTGDYYFSLSGSPSLPALGGYTLVASLQPADDYPASNKTTALLTFMAPVHGVIGVRDDHDWVKVKLVAGHSYTFSLQGKLSGSGSLNTADAATGLTLYSDKGVSLGTSLLPSDNGAEPRLKFVAAASSDAYLDVHGNNLQTGSYTLYETDTVPDTTAPKLQPASLQPPTVDVALNAKFSLLFDESVVLGSGVTLKDAYGVTVPMFASASGYNLAINVHQILKPGMSYTLALPEGSVIDLAGNRFLGLQNYTFTTRLINTVGGAGDDYLSAKGNGLLLNGGAGIDTAYYDDSQGALQVTRSAGQVVVKAAGAAVGDTLIGVERLLFPDHALALDIDGNGGQGYRLYQAAFNRAPDSEGLGFWISALDRGVDLKTVAQGFVGSTEFKTLYGEAPSDAAFVKLLYNNVLHRAPDQAGTDFWVQGLHNGASRADILVNFSESPENQAALLSVIGNGFAYTPYG